MSDDTTQYTSTGIAYQRSGPTGAVPVVLIHAGITDRRMWDPIWPALTVRHDALRLDLRGFGESAARPQGALDPVADLHTTMAEAGIGSCHLIGASFGAGVAVEYTLAHPAQVHSLLLVTPGGSLIDEVTQDLEAFISAEDAAMERGDLDGAAEANVRWWVDGPHRGPDDVDTNVRAGVHQMQLRAFELTQDWDDIDEHEADPPALQRLSEIAVPTTVLTGALDISAIAVAAHAVTTGISGAQHTDWPGVAHLPAMERPEQFLQLLTEWLN